METALPHEIIALIVEYDRSPLLREVSRLFCVLCNAALLDNVSSRPQLATKGDLYSLMIRYKCGDITTEELEYISYYVTHRTQWYISKDVIKASCIVAGNTIVANDAVVKRVIRRMLDSGVAISLRRFNCSSICHVIDNMTFNLDLLPIFREIIRMKDTLSSGDRVCLARRLNACAGRGGEIDSFGIVERAMGDLIHELLNPLLNTPI